MSLSVAISKEGGQLSFLSERRKQSLLPEKADIFVLKADRRNCVRSLDVSGLIVIRLIYDTEDTEMTNHWRVTDYNSEGSVIMSVLCQFLKRFAQGVKRKATEEESSSRSPTPPKKHFRL